jgi:two-component system, cell cycle response regulator
MADILLVEDNARQRADFEDALTRAGHRVDAVASGNQALSRLKKGNYAILVTDLMMKEGTGFDVLYWVILNAPGMPVLVSSAFGEPATLKEMLKAHPCRVLKKPFRLDDLVQQVSELLGSSA